MGILLAFLPFIVFAVLERLFGPETGLIGGTAMSGLLLARDGLAQGRSPKILEVGTVLLFASLTVYTLLATPHWSVMGVRLCVDAGLLAIVLASMAVGRPFTLQYAKERVDRAHWDSPVFRRTNMIITAAWAAAFAVMVIAELALVYVPEMPKRVGMIAIVLALVGAVRFTAWYPDHIRKQAVPAVFVGSAAQD